MFFRVALFALLLLPGVSHAAALPRIIADADNPVPQCVRPAALMDFVAARNAQHNPPRTIDPRFANLASLYQRIGHCVARAAGAVRRRALGLRLLPDADRNQLPHFPPAQRRARISGAGRQ